MNASQQQQLHQKHNIPNPIEKDQKKVHEIIIVITVEDYEAHRARFCQRYEENPDRPAGKYLEHFEAIRDIQVYISKLVRDFNIPIINNINLDETVELTLEEITKGVQ